MTGISIRPLDWGMPGDDGFCPLGPDWIEQPVIAAFKQIAKANPDRLAISDGTRRWNYAELDDQVEAISGRLAAAWPIPPSAIALAMDNDARAPAAMLGALALGIAYVPIDLSFPVERNIQILRHSGVSAIVTTLDRQAMVLPLADKIPVMVIDDPGAPLAPLHRASPDHIAYVLYTSGSSGHPKGVYQNQRGLLHDVKQYINSVHLTSADRMTMLYSPSVNGAIRDIFGGLLTGAAVHIVDLRTNGLAGIADVLRRESITIYHSMPPVLRAFLGGLSPEDKFEQVRLVYLAGDRLFRRDVMLCRQHFADHATLYVALGSTENATIFRQWFISATTPLNEDLIPVGYQVPERRSELIGEDGTPVAPGEAGEIVVTSRHMALGYWNAPELSATAFAPCPQTPGVRQYQTGDLGREDADGLLHFIGRKDRQIKIRGYRVEPAEVEAVLRLCPGVADAAVIPRHRGETGELVAFIVPTNDAGTNPTAWLAERLPPHMRPTTLHSIPAIPALPNLKTDSAALVAIDDQYRENQTPAPLPPIAKTSAQSLYAAVHLAVCSNWTLLLGETAFRADTPWDEANGDSLKAMELILAIETQLGRQIAAEVFSVKIRPSEFTAQLMARFDVPIWLDDDQFRAVIEGYAGDQPSPFPATGFDNFSILSENVNGTLPPLFWCTQNRNEHRHLAAALGPDQPVYCMPSGHPLRNTVGQQLLLGRRYAQTIPTIADGPYIMGGFCQGAYVAFEAARHLLEQGHQVRLLLLIEATILRPYPGQVALLFGNESIPHNPFLMGLDPRSDWDKLYTGYSIDLVSSSHNQFFQTPENLDELAGTLQRNLLPPHPGRANRTVSAVIVSFCTGSPLRECLRTVLEQTEIAEVIVVDNGNDAESRAFLENLTYQSARVRIIRPGNNIGFAAACNLGAAKARSDYVALINPDLVVPPHSFTKVLTTFEDHPEAWLCGGRLLDMDGSEQRGGRREILTPWRSLAEMLQLEKLFPGHPHFRRLNMHEGEALTTTTEVPCISGAFMVMPLARWQEIGGMDANMFLHVEDTELCLRVLQAGGTILYCGDTPIYHHRSTSHISRAFIEWHKTRSAIYYFRKHFCDSYPNWALRLMAGGLWIRWAIMTLSAAPNDIRRWLKDQRNPDHGILRRLRTFRHERKQCRKIAESGLFDANFYRTTNPDIVVKGEQAILHYLRHGWKEGRKPCATFCPDAYLAANRDVAAIGIEPLTHYIDHGMAEGRLLSTDQPTRPHPMG